MYYYGARYYSPWLCRFISVDPLAAKYPFYTPYQYAGNQPINFIDLDGMEQAPPPTPSAGSSIPIPAVNNVNQKSSTITTLQPGLAPNPNTLSLGTVKPKVNTPPPSKVTPPSTAFTPSQDSGANSSSNAATEKIQKSQQSAALASQKLQSPTAQLSADFRPDDLRAKSADDTEMYITLQKIGDAVPLFGEFIKAGSYNAMGMTEQRNASLLKGSAEVALTVGLAYVAPEAITFETLEARGVTNVAAKGGGRLGNTATRNQIGEIATTLESRGYTITGGGGRTAEEFLKPLGGGRKGGSFLDITATHPNYPTLRINTVDVYKNGLPTLRELNNAVRIRTQIAPGEHLLLIPKR